ncbi:MAG TPA: hypothetical protein VGM40_01010 [Mycobacterium sp.]
MTSPPDEYKGLGTSSMCQDSSFGAQMSSPLAPIKGAHQWECPPTSQRAW